MFFKKISKKAAVKKAEAALALKPPPPPVVQPNPPSKTPIRSQPPPTPPQPQPLPTPPPVATPVPAPPKQEETENQVQSDIPNNDCKPLEIAHIDQEETVEDTPVPDDTNTMNVVLDTSATKNDEDTTHGDTANDIVPKEEAPLTQSISDTTSIQKDLVPNVSLDDEEIDEK